MKTLTMDSDLSYIILIASWLVEETGYEYPGCQRLFYRGFQFLSSLYCDPRVFSRLRPTTEDVSAFSQHRKFPSHARKTSGTQGRLSKVANIKQGNKGFAAPRRLRSPFGPFSPRNFRCPSWGRLGGGGGVWSWIISGTIHIFLLSEQNGWLTAERLFAWLI